jgi:hypothetical protein
MAPDDAYIEAQRLQELPLRLERKTMFGYCWWTIVEV